MTNEYKVKFGRAANSSCVICGCVIEAILHVLRDCHTKKSIWQTILLDVWLQNQSMPLKDWVASNVTGSLMVGAKVGWGLKFAIMVWWLWKWRNVYF